MDIAPWGKTAKIVEGPGDVFLLPPMNSGTPRPAACAVPCFGMLAAETIT
jgi:hypothetical protein